MQLYSVVGLVSVLNNRLGLQPSVKPLHKEAFIPNIH